MAECSTASTTVCGSPAPCRPARPAWTTGSGSNRLRWGPNTPLPPWGETVGYNSEAAYDPTNKLTLIVWSNLTISPFDGLTANRLMLNVLDRAYKLSPLTPGVTAPQPG